MPDCIPVQGQSAFAAPGRKQPLPGGHCGGDGRRGKKRVLICECPAMSPMPDPVPSLPTPLSAQKRALHTGPIVQATPADLDIRQDSSCLPSAQSPAADWQFRQQFLFVHEGPLATGAFCPVGHAPRQLLRDFGNGNAGFSSRFPPGGRNLNATVT